MPKITSGMVFENTVKSVFQSKHYDILSYSQWNKNPDLFKRDVLLTNVPYKTIYGHNGRTEFLILSESKGLKTRVEMKWQQTSGSVDEKLPYLYLNALFTMPESHIIIVIDGEGFKEGAIRWLKDSVAKKYLVDPAMPEKRIDVLTLAGFVTWANIHC